MVPLNFVRTFLTRSEELLRGLFFPGKRGSAGAHHYTRLEEEFLENPKVSASAEGYDMADRSFSLLRREWASSRTHAQRRRRSENKAWQIHR
jgi:hypothetical protein